MPSTGARAARISIIDIALAAGVSPSTVSRVFNRPALVLPDTRETVMDTAARLGYRPNASARTLRTRRSGTRREAEGISTR